MRCFVAISCGTVGSAGGIGVALSVAACAGERLPGLPRAAVSGWQVASLATSYMKFGMLWLGYIV